MGDPYFKIRAFLERNGVAAFSSNYTLYGELSHRMAMATASLVSAVEQYSIDDALGYVLSLNLYRRQLTVAQRALIAAELSSLRGSSTITVDLEKAAGQELCLCCGCSKEAGESGEGKNAGP